MVVNDNFKDSVNNQGVLMLIYSFILCIILGNLIEYQQHLVLSPTTNVNNAQKVKIYDCFELKQIRSWMNKNPGMVKISPDVILNIRTLKIHRKRKRKCWGGSQKVQLPSNGVNKGNLITVPTSNFGLIENTLQQNLI